jgi:hypothetical protein
MPKALFASSVEGLKLLVHEALSYIACSCGHTLCHRRCSHQALFASIRYATGAVRILYILTGSCAAQGGSGDIRLDGRVRVDSTDVVNWSRAEQRLRQYLYFCTSKASKLSNSCVSICFSLIEPE